LSCFQRGKGKGVYYYESDDGYDGYGGKGGKGGKGSKGSKGKKAPKVTLAPAPVPVDPPTFAPAPVDMGTIVDFVAGNPDLSSLLLAVGIAGLTEELDTGGPYTLFAPNDAAFGGFPADVLNSLLGDLNFIPQLQDLLFLHVIGGTFLAAELESVRSLVALNRELVFIDSPPLTVNGNNVVDGNNIVSNGVVHIIDDVLIPSWVFNSLADRIFFDDDLFTLFGLLATVGIDLSEPSALTVAAPTNAAFDLIPQATLDSLLAEPDFVTLIQILTYHVFFGILTSSILVDGFVATLEGGGVNVSTTPTLMFNQATAVQVDILANNGVLHKIDMVLDPADSP
jgi:transforming growth factor-beta-induced protein